MYTGFNKDAPKVLKSAIFSYLEVVGKLNAIVSIHCVLLSFVFKLGFMSPR